MVKPVGSFEWGIALLGTAVVATIVMLYAIGWARREDPAGSPVRVEAEVATTVVRSPPARAVTPRAGTPSRKPAYVLTAARGDSWLLVRERSFRGRLLFQGVLPHGKTLAFRAARLWIRFGAAGNVDVAVGGRKVRLPSNGTFDAYVSPRGVVADRTDYATAAQSP